MRLFTVEISVDEIVVAGNFTVRLSAVRFLRRVFSVRLLNAKLSVSEFSPLF